MEKLHLIYLALMTILFLGHASFATNAQERQNAALEKEITIVAHPLARWENGTASLFDLPAANVNWMISGKLAQLMQSNITIMQKTMEETKGYIGMWVTADGYIRQELLPGNRYDEARGNRSSAYQGNYQVTGNDIYYKDDTGFTADGKFVNENTLHHGGYVFYKEVKKEKQ